MDKKPTNSAANAAYNEVAPGYLATAQHAPAGRTRLDWHDDAKSPQVAIVNQTFARKVFGITNVLGRVFLQRTRSRQVIGVVEDGKYENLAEDPSPAVFVPIAQHPSSATILLVRSSSTASELAAQTQRALAQRIKQLDPSIPVTTESWRQSLTLILFPSVVISVALRTNGGLGGHARAHRDLRHGSIATWVPAGRAIAADPVRLLRED